ncbi:cyclin-D4-1-like [Primulina tabacum]|uniref:cyclin-D4-1-like n=1 Tax=Primulina tabacum TaxID=48773 RepID=UPI003F5AA91B
MAEREREFLLGDAYLERLRSGELVLGFRKEALDWMYKAGEMEVVFQGKTVQRMEIVVLEYVKWRMKAYTPRNCIDYCLRKINDIEITPEPLISRSVEIILSTIKGFDFLGFRPSEIVEASCSECSLPRFTGIEKAGLEGMTNSSGSGFQSTTDHVENSVEWNTIGTINRSAWK